MRDEAIGAFEAAAILGVHFTKPRIMAEKGMLSSRMLLSNESREFAVYSRRECERDYQDYREAMENGGSGRRARTAVHMRPIVHKVLADPERPQIEYEDAIGVYEAARILGVFPSFPPRLARAGHIAGRIVWSQRAGRSRLWIFSRRSCEKRAAAVRQSEAAGRKVGRPRKAAKKC